MVKYASPFMLWLWDVLKFLLSEKIESCGKCMEDRVGANRKSLSLYSSLKSALLSAASQSSSFLYILTWQFLLPSPLRWLMPFGFSRICSRTPALPLRLIPSRPWSMNGRCRWSPTLTLQSSKNTSRRWWRWVFSHPRMLLFPVGADCMLQSKRRGQMRGYLFSSSLQLSWHYNCSSVTSGDLKHGTGVLVFQFNLGLSQLGSSFIWCLLCVLQVLT